MRKLFSIGLFLILLYYNVNAQSIFRVIKPARVKLFKKPELSLQISRVTIVESSSIESAIIVAQYQSRLRHQEQLYQQQMLNTSNQPVLFLSQEIHQTICKPEKLYGSYNYLRLCSQNMKESLGWKNINKADSYNGVHHIINLSTLNELYLIVENNYNQGIITTYPFYNDFIKNAPAIFHKFHNDPRMRELFHNKEMQLLLYNQYGVKGILDNFFKAIIILNQSNGLEPIEQEIIQGSYLEAKLWCDNYGLKWE